MKTAHNSLMRVLGKMKKSAMWQRMPKKRGAVKKVSLTKAGNMKMVIETLKEDVVCYVLFRNTNLFSAASELKKGSRVSVALRRSLGKWYCTKIAGNEQKELGDFARRFE